MGILILLLGKAWEYLIRYIGLITILRYFDVNIWVYFLVIIIYTIILYFTFDNIGVYLHMITLFVGLILAVIAFPVWYIFIYVFNLVILLVRFAIISKNQKN